LGSFDPKTLEMSDLLSQIYTAAGHHREAMRLHEEILRLVVEGDDGDDRTLDTMIPKMAKHAISALNFQSLWSAIGVLAWLIAWRPPVFLPLLVVTAVGVVFGVIGGLRANNGTVYAYPMSPRLVR